jgi:hypothetical protein
VLGLLKKLFFWNYARSSWQWDALCVVILIFIFLTPKSWFGSGERHPSEGHQIRTISTLLLSAEVVENEQDKAQLQDRIRVMTGRSDAQVLEVRKRIGQDGRTLGYEVDIR